MPAPRSGRSSETLAVRLRGATSRLMRRLRVDSRAGALAAAKWSALAQLHAGGTLSPSELARREHVKLQTLTRLTAELEAAGLVARSADPDDGRRSRLALTPAGAARLASEVRRREASLQAAVQSLDEGERLALLDACALLDRVADALPGGAGAAAAPARPRRARAR